MKNITASGKAQEDGSPSPKPGADKTPAGSETSEPSKDINTLSDSNSVGNDNTSLNNEQPKSPSDLKDQLTNRPSEISFDKIQVMNHVTPAGDVAETEELMDTREGKIDFVTINSLMLMFCRFYKILTTSQMPLLVRSQS